MLTNVKIGNRLFIIFAVLLLMTASSGIAKVLFTRVGTAVEGFDDQVGKTLLARDIRDELKGAVEDGVRITGVNREVNQIVSSIATAIDEVSSNLSQAAIGIQDANRRVAQGAGVTVGIARDIAGVDHAAQDVARGVDQVQASALDLSRLAEALDLTVRRFRTGAATSGGA